MYDEKRKRSTAKYVKEHLDDIKVRVPKGERARYKNIAEEMNLSMNQLFIQATNEYIIRYYSPISIITPIYEDINEMEQFSKFAADIFMKHYIPIIGEEQSNYMIEKFLSYSAMLEKTKDGYHYFRVLHECNDIGFLAVKFLDNTLYLDKFYLHDGARGKGYARFMMHFLEKLAIEHSLPCITLNVNKYNPTIGFYEKMGFQKIREEINDIGNGYVMDDYVYLYRVF